MKTLILTPNKNLQCGMYQLAQDLAKEFAGDIKTKGDKLLYDKKYNQVITLLYPMHKHGKYMKNGYGLKWICYDQGIPPVTKTYFPNFFRRQYMKLFTWLNNRSMKGADEYWNVTEREQMPRWTKKARKCSISYHAIDMCYGYAIYLGRTTDYKNYEWLTKTMKGLGIPLIHPENEQDYVIHEMLSNAKMLVTASLWEGYGRPVQEAETLGIPTVAYDVGAHKRHIKKGICVPLDLKNMEKSERDFKQAILKVWKK